MGLILRVVGGLLLLVAGSAGAASPPVVAVFDLETRGIALSGQVRRALSDYLADSLAATGAFRLVPRDRLHRRLGALKRRSYRDCHDRSCQIELGRELAASGSLAPRLLRIGSRCVATATLYDLRRETTERGATVEGRCSRDALRGLVAGLVARLAGRAPPAPRANSDRPGQVDPGRMAAIPAGPFLRGADDGPEDEQPARTIHLDAFLIDRHEVTIARYLRCVRAGRCGEPATATGCDWRRSDRDDHPVTCVDWTQASAYCAWVGKRLPSEAEWERAARGPSGRTFPWGEQAADCRRAVMSAEAPGCGARGAAAVGSRSPAGDSPEGVSDLAGNVWEWVGDWYRARYYRIGRDRNPTGPASGASRVMRGGSWQDDGADLRGARRDHAPPTFRHRDLGFRCARDAP